MNLLIKHEGSAQNNLTKYLEETRKYELEYTGLEAEHEAYSYEDEMPYDVRNIRIEQKMITIFQIEHWITNNVLNLTPEYQRNLVWDAHRKTALIESLMLRIPIPAFYLDEGTDGVKYVIDGMQRLSTIHEFLNDGFQLKKMQYLTSCEQKVFSQLDIKFRSYIEDTALAVNILDARCPQIVKFDVFRRVNTGGLPLNPQEIRNIMAAPDVRTLLREMSTCREFVRATGGRINDIRMGAQELCLRYLTISDLYVWADHDFRSFGGLLKELDSMILKLNRLPGEKLWDHLEAFQIVMDQCSMILGDLFFCKYNSRIINKTIFTSWAVVLANLKLDQETVKRYAEATRYLYLDHVLKTDGFQEVVTSSTGSRKNILASIEYIRNIMERMVKNDSCRDLHESGVQIGDQR